MTSPKVNLASPWKDILRAYLPQSIEFFFPSTAALIDWDYPPEFLDKEFQKISKDGELGRRYADQLIKVRLKDGDELWLLIHLEVQSQREKDFAQRMFAYSLRIFDRFQRIPVSLAILCDESPTWRPHRYQVEYPDTTHCFTFGTAKLLDYAACWDDLEQNQNPFAVVVMAHLKTQATKTDQNQRKQWKFSLIRNLYDRGYDRQEITDLYRFIDWIMALPADLEQACWEELKNFEEGRNMTYVTYGERVGYQRGHQKGLEEGRQEGRQEGESTLLIRLLTQKVGAIPADLQTAIQQLEVEELEALGESLFDISSVSDIEAWLNTK